MKAIFHAKKILKIFVKKSVKWRKVERFPSIMVGDGNGW